MTDLEWSVDPHPWCSTCCTTPDECTCPEEVSVPANVVLGSE